MIGNDVSIAHGVSILTTEHRFDSVEIPIRDQGTRSLPTILGSDVWIGAGARISGGWPSVTAPSSRPEPW